MSTSICERNYENGAIGEGSAVSAKRYIFDRNGNRLAEYVTIPDGGERLAVLYIYDPLNRMIALVDTNDILAIRYRGLLFYKHDTETNEGTASSAMHTLYDMDAEVVTMRGDWQVFHLVVDNEGIIESEAVSAASEATRRYSLPNHRNDTVAYMNEEGDVARRFSYDAFGAVREMTADRDNNLLEIPRFTGRSLAAGRRTYDFRYRHYDSGTAVFQQPDPLMFYANPSGNIYSYVNNHPINMVDPYGLDSSSWCRCGMEAGPRFASLMNKVGTWYASQGFWDKRNICALARSNPGNGWDISETVNIGGIGPRRFRHTPSKCGGPDNALCDRTVQIFGDCYHEASVNYMLWGKLGKLCDFTPYHSATLLQGYLFSQWYNGVGDGPKGQAGKWLWWRMGFDGIFAWSDIDTSLDFWFGSGILPDPPAGTGNWNTTANLSKYSLCQKCPEFYTGSLTANFITWFGTQYTVTVP